MSAEWVAYYLEISLIVVFFFFTLFSDFQKIQICFFDCLTTVQKYSAFPWNAVFLQMLSKQPF